jgi:hypothetical protein
MYIFDAYKPCKGLRTGAFLGGSTGNSRLASRQHSNGAQSEQVSFESEINQHNGFSLLEADMKLCFLEASGSRVDRA